MQSNGRPLIKVYNFCRIISFVVRGPDPERLTFTIHMIRIGKIGLFSSLFGLILLVAWMPADRARVTDHKPGRLPSQAVGKKTNGIQGRVKQPVIPFERVTPDSLLRQADRFVGWKAYGRAIDIYTQLLEDPSQRLVPNQRINALSGLAFSYQQVGDLAKAEHTYRTLLSPDISPNPDPKLVRAFAQVLAGSGKMKESDEQFERYLKLMDELVARRASQEPRVVGDRSKSKDPIRYRLEYLGINTRNEEFSPAYYKDGLVYVSGSKGGSSIETTGSGGGAGYLDLYYVPNRNQLKVAEIINADGSASKAQNERIRNGKRTGGDDHTRITANDSRTVMSYDASINISEGLGYDTRPTNPAQRFSQTLNTRYHEGPATFYRDGSKIIFTRNNFNSGRARKSAEGVNKLKLYTASQQNGAWENIEELPFNSDEYSVGHPSLGKDLTGAQDRFLFFASDMPGGFGGSDLYVTRWENGNWSKPVNLGASVNTKGNELFPFVDEAGNLYFASDGLKGLGGLDIFYATMAGTMVRSVDHLDAPLNSPQDDFGLITDGSRRAGYFSSNRRAGNDDIYRFVRESSLYSCRDLTLRLYDTDTDEPLDSVVVDIKMRGEGRADQQVLTDKSGLLKLCLEADNDFVFSASKDGYISSTIGFTTRFLTDDQPSRLEMALSKPTMLVDTLEEVNPSANSVNLNASRVRGKILGEKGKPIEGVLIRLRNECNGQVLSTTTGPDGVYVFNLIEGCDYTLIASKEKYGTNTSKIKKLPKKSKPKEVSADLRMLSVGEVIPIDEIHFDLDRESIRPDASRELDKLVATMRKYPSLIIEIRSHTDSRGDASYNKTLSTRRAQSVANYLISKGISRKRITANGYGESMLLNNCTDGIICTEAEHQRNRRTEFKVLAIK